MIIALDFDRTLFDRDSMYEFSRNNSELKDIEDPLDFKKRFNELVEEDILGDDFSEFLYPDVIPFLEKHKDKKLILISTATYSSQQKVVKGTGILDYFSEVYFVDSNDDKVDVLENCDGKVVLLDDLEDTLYDVQSKCKNSTVVLMDRNNVANSKGFPVVSNLEEFERFIS